MPERTKERSKCGESPCTVDVPAKEVTLATVKNPASGSDLPMCPKSGPVSTACIGASGQEESVHDAPLEMELSFIEEEFFQELDFADHQDQVPHAVPPLSSPISQLLTQ